MTKLLASVPWEKMWFGSKVSNLKLIKIKWLSVTKLIALVPWEKMWFGSKLSSLKSVIV